MQEMTLRALCAARDYNWICEELGLVDYPEGQAPHYADIGTVLGEIKRLRKVSARLIDVQCLLEKNGCDCECDCHPVEHGDECELCLACRIATVMR